MRHIIFAIIFSCFFIVSTNSFATSTLSNTTSKKTTADFVGKQADNRTFKGIVKKLKSGTALYTQKSVYPLTGGDFGMIIGKKVSIIGKIIKEGEVEKLAVTRVQLDK